MSDDLLLQLIEAFEDCAGFSASPDEAYVVHQAITRIVAMDHVPRELVEVGLKMASLAPVEPESEEGPETPMFLMLGRLQKSSQAHAVVAQASQTLSSQHDVTIACEVLTGWSDQGQALTAPEELKTQADEAAETLSQAVRDFAQKTVTEAKRALIEALPACEKLAGGRREAESKWKDELTESSSWEAVVTAANMHFFHGEGGTLKDRLKVPHADVTRTLGIYREALDHARDTAVVVTASDDDPVEDARLTERAEGVLILSLETSSEAYFVEVLAKERKDKMAPKLQTRMASMSKKGVNPANLQKAVWEKVLTLATD